MKTSFAIGLVIITLISNNIFAQKHHETREKASGVKIAGAMKNVMWNGELAGVINLDTIQNKAGLYGLGPLEYLTGEILVTDGKTYVSTALSDSAMKVVETSTVSAPFFVYANATAWNEEMLSEDVITIKDLEEYLDAKASGKKVPFVFKLKGRIQRGGIHTQNLPKGTKVSSPQDAHQGQINFDLENQEVEIIGFYSTEHKGIFTHHDSHVHMHLITADKSKMGHLDYAVFEKNGMKLFLPK